MPSYNYHQRSWHKVNLLFSWENNIAKVDSELPKKDNLAITVKQSLNLLVRILGRVVSDFLKVSVDGQPAGWSCFGEFILISNKKADVVFNVSFTPKRCDTNKFVYHRQYRISWFGEQAIGISPENGVYLLFGEWQ